MNTAFSSYFADAERRAQMRAEAESWLGTPFFHRGNIQGAGADCVHFIAEVMRACGVIEGYVFPPYSRDWQKHQTRSLVLEWLEACPRFARLPDADSPLPGDVSCHRVNKCVHHCALVLEPPLLIHALRGHGVDYGRMDDPSLSERLQCYYRPLPL